MASSVDSTSNWTGDEFVHINNITKEWILVATPVPMLLLLMVYGLILFLGPRLMENREPYKLKIVMRIYNIFQVMHNLSMVYPFIEDLQLLPLIISTSCSPVVLEDDQLLKYSYTYSHYCWNFMISKQIDLLDTVFMVLRKKNSHITFLHVYHHVAMVFFTWVTIYHTESHQGIIPGLINVIIHSIMYSYYFLATFNRFRRLLWWKNYLTKLQLGQFVIILTYFSLLYHHGCHVSRVFTFMWAFNVFIFLILFINFYVKAYVVKSGARTIDDKTHKECTKKEL